MSKDRQNLTLDGFTAFLQEMRYKNKDAMMSAALPDVAAATAKSVGRSFEQSRSPDGVAFSPVRRGGRPLVLSGLMYSEAKRSAEVMTYTGTTFTTRMNGPFYAQFHQYGTSRIVPRTFYGIDDEAETEIEEAVGGHMIVFMFGR